MEGITQRAELLVIGFVLTFAALALVPRSRSWTTALGGRTFYCYLLHGYVILFLQLQFDVFDRIDRLGFGAVVLCTALALIGGNLLMLGPVATLFRPLFEPQLTWLFRSAPQPAPPAAADPSATVASGGTKDEGSR
jgi:fucose 4-O-acetylase-like acetyltransferase